jgi:hypothetical protein
MTGGSHATLAATWAWPSQPVLTGAQPHRRWAADDGGDARGLPRTHEWAKKIWEWTRIALVAAPLWIGRRSELRWTSPRWCTTANNDYMLRFMLSLNKRLQGITSSPGDFWKAWSDRSWSESTAIRRRTAARGKREWLPGVDWEEINSIPLTGMHNSTRRSSEAARIVFRWPSSTAT